MTAKFKLPNKKDKKKPTGMRSVNFRIPLDMLTAFNAAVVASKLSGQDVVESMVRHCLKDAGYK
jgi:AAA+ superfamily predicted ATPase